MAELISMSQKEIKRYGVIKKLLNREFNGSEAAVILKLSTRHIRRLKNKVRQDGAKGLVHGSRGRAGNRKIPDQTRNKIIKLLHEQYYDFGPGLAAEKLAKNHGINHDPKTIRQIMIGEELWRPRKIRGGKNNEHRQWRQRKANYGEMIQYDGSYEHWFEDRGEKCCLLAAIDDAKGVVPQAKFASSEGVEPTFGFWKEYIVKNGKPYSIYVDKFSTYSMNHQTAKENEDALTQFKRAMEKDLQIEVITANSPQAKGRNQAIRQLNLKEEIAKLDEKGIVHAIRTKKDLDEASGDYKDIGQVMRLQADLVEIVTEFEPLAVIKA